MGTELIEKERESVRGNTWIYYKVEAAQTESVSPAEKPADEVAAADDDDELQGSLLRSPEDIGLKNTDGTGTYYSFIYDGMEFTAIYTEDNWKIMDSYRVPDINDMIFICEALIAEHPIHGADMASYRTADDMAFEWMQHNAAYSVLPEGSEWLSHAKDVDLDPYDQGKSFIEIYEERTGKKFNLEDIL